MMMDPERLKTSKATKLERRMLSAAAEESPSPELTNRMRQAVGLYTSGAGATALAATKATGLAWISAGIVAAAIVGGAVGLWTSARRNVSTAGAQPAAQTQCAVSSPGIVEPASAGAPSSDRPAHRVHARNRAALAATTETGPPDLRDEIALVDQARTALRQQSPRRALALLRRYAATYPEGTFGPEAEALRVEALDGSGQHRLAESLARDFLVRHPESPLAERIGRSIGDRP